MALKKITVVGRLGKDAQVKEHEKNHALSFSIAADTGYGDKKVTDWFDVVLWVFGDKGTERAKKLGEMLVKGTEVCVVGDFSTNKSGDKTYLKIKLGGFDDLQITKFGAAKKESTEEETSDGQGEDTPVESPDIPF